MVLKLDDSDLTEKLCYGIGPKPIVLSWSRLSDWMKCKQRIKLTYQGKKSKVVNGRNFLTGNLVDHSMRHALETAVKDGEGRLKDLPLGQIMDQLPKEWDKIMGDPEKGTIMKWRTADPKDDQRKIIDNAQRAIEGLHPILVNKLMGKRFIPEFRPKVMPPFGIPGPDGEPCFIRLFLAVDCAIQLEEDPHDPQGIGKWGLFDLKTTEQIEYIGKTLPQLVFYDLGFHAHTGVRPVEHALWTPLMDTNVQTIDVTDEHRLEVIKLITRYCHSVWRAEETLTDDESNCFNCPTKLACPKFVKPLTKDEQGISRFSFGGTLDLKNL